MRVLLIVGIVLLLVFAAVLLIAPGGGPLDVNGQQAVANGFEADGPPGWLNSLGSMIPARPIAIEQPPANCPDGTTHFAAAGDGWRVLHLGLKEGVAVLAVVSLLDPRRDHESGPYRICLGQPDPIGCSNDRIGPKATVPIGPRGACIAVIARVSGASVAFN